MATDTFGQTGNGGSNSTSSADANLANRSTEVNSSPASNGTLTSVQARLWLSATGSTKVQAAVWDSSGNLLATSTEITMTNTTETELTLPFTGLNQISLTAGTGYTYGISWKDPGTPNVTWSRAAVASTSFKNNVAYVTGSPQDPIGTGTVTGPVDMYVIYTIASGTTTTQTQTGKARVTGITLKTQTGKARISGTTSQTITGKSSIIPTDQVDSYQSVASPPTTDANLSYLFLAADYANVAANDTVYFDGAGSNTYNVTQFKKKNPNGNSTDVVTLSYNGKSTVATSTTPAVLQIYNYVTPGWETINSNTTTAAGTEFTITGSPSGSAASYYTTGNWIAVRIYQ